MKTSAALCASLLALAISIFSLVRAEGDGENAEPGNGGFQVTLEQIDSNPILYFSLDRESKLRFQIVDLKKVPGFFSGNSRGSRDDGWTLEEKGNEEGVFSAWLSQDGQKALIEGKKAGDAFLWIKNEGLGYGKRILVCVR